MGPIGEDFIDADLDLCLIYVQGGATKRNPDMDKSAVWAGSGCMAVSPISGLRLVAPLCMPHMKAMNVLFHLLYGSLFCSKGLQSDRPKC